ncbi:MAG: hypothetical protein JXR64_02865 [Spirochaetales bacterium]|nr:hypothetical protein [Spirochaetales bacterium]
MKKNLISDKVLPHADDFEEALLGILLDFPKAIDKIIHFMRAEVFYKDKHQSIYKTIIYLHKKNIPIDILTVSNEMNKRGILDNCGGSFYLVKLTGTQYLDRNKTLYYSLVLLQNYLKRELIRIGLEISNDAYDKSTDVFILIDKIKAEIDTLDGIINKINNKSKDAVKNALKGIKDRISGLVIAFIKTGDEKFDMTFSLEPRTISVIAGQKGHLKSKFVLYLAEKLDQNNPDMAFYWLSMEEPAEKIVRGKISYRTGISEKKLLSKTANKLSDDEMELVEKVSSEIEQQNVIYIDKKTSMTNITTGFKTFVKENPDKTHVLIVDNLGLITNDDFKGTSIEIDDHIAGRFVEIRDQTNAIIIIIHHLTKSHLSQFNLIDGYRPREEHVRGSARILDYADNVILGNKPGKFSDLVRDEIAKSLNGKFNYKKDDSLSDIDNLIEAFLSINPYPDKIHKDSTPDSFRNNLEANIKIVFREAKLMTYFKGITNPSVASDIILYRYLQYYNEMESINAKTEARFKKPINDVVTFLSKQQFKTPPKINKESREWYLYGNDVDVLQERIKDIFIIDGTKIRNGSHDDDDTLIRYIADGSNNQFIQITEKLTNEWRK